MNTHSARRSWWKQCLLACVTLVLSVYVLFNCLLGFIVTLGENGRTGQRWSSRTAGEAKLNGTFVTTLDADPPDIDWHGQQITINEAWVEHQSQRVYTVVLVPGLLDIPINRQLPGYCIGMNLKQGRDCFIGGTPHFSSGTAGGLALRKCGPPVTSGILCRTTISHQLM